MKLIDKIKFRKSMWYISTFLITVVLFGVALIMIDIVPFGDNSFLIIDTERQYVHFIEYLRRFFNGEEGSLLYSLSLGLGDDFLPTFAYYLSSPITIIGTLIYSFFEGNHISLFMTLLILINLALASCAMLFYLERKHHVLSINTVVFSCAYALCGYNIVYLENYIWLSGVIMLPIILRFTDAVLCDKKYSGLILSVALLMFSNFYIGYMVLLFAFIYFLLNYLFFYSEGNNFKIILKEITKYIIALIVGCLLVSFLMVPTAFSVLSNRGVSSGVSFIWNFDNIKSIFQIFIAQSNQITSNTFPLMYSTICAVVLFGVALFNKKIDIKYKAYMITLIFIFLISIVFEPLYLFWHLFTLPQGFPFRFTFCINFIMISVAYYSLIKSTSKPTRIGLTLVTFGLFVLLQLGKYQITAQYIYENFKVNVVIILLVWCVLMFKAKLIYLVILVELGLNTYFTLNYMSFASDDSIANADLVINDNLYLNDLYRSEVVSIRVSGSKMESLSYGYHSISSFYSTANLDVMEMMSKLGYSSWTLGVEYNEFNPFADSLLGLKNIITYRQNPFSSGNSEFHFVNDYALPMAFVSNVDLNIDLDSDWLSNQNDLSKRLLGNNIYTEVNFNQEEIVNMDNLSSGQQYSYRKINDWEQGILTYSLNGLEEGDKVFVSFTNSSLGNTADYIFNGMYSAYITGRDNHVPVYLGEAISGENKFQIMNYSSSYDYENIQFLVYNDELLQKLDETTRTDFLYEDGKISVDAKAGEYLYLSIPKIDSIKIIHNNENSNNDLWLGTLIRIPLDEGLNEIEVYYFSETLLIGCLISGCTLLVLLLVMKKKINN